MIDPGLPGAMSALARDAPTMRDPATAAEMLALLRFLYAVGRRDLPLGRLIEGHVDAIHIVTRYANAATAERCIAEARAGRWRLGVWNAPLPDMPLLLDPDRSALTGGKSFASGAGILTHALVTAGPGEAPQLVLVDLARSPPEIESDWWLTVGMQRSETHRVRWRETPIDANDRVGAPGDYKSEPWFTGGALRFAAVQAGGIAALCDHVRDHLVARERDGDPHQRGRLAALYIAAQSAASSVREAASRWHGAAIGEQLALVAAARATVYAQGDRAIGLAQQAVGLDGLFVGHPLARALTDLTVYLRQPGPDAQRMRVAAAVADGTLSPVL